MKLSRTAIAIIIGLALIETGIWAFAVLPSMRSQQKAVASEDGAKDSAGSTEKKTADSAAKQTADATKKEAGTVQDDKLAEEMKDKLSPEQYNVCFLKGTEPPFSGKYYKNHDPGEYRCAVCQQLLFLSDTKFDSGTGWPSFWEGAEPGAISEVEDLSHGMRRVEVNCSKCGSHLGHVFPDGPPPSGMRYCINSLSLEFIPAEQAKKEREEQAAEK